MEVAESLGEKAPAFYDDRYAAGYMDEWPASKKQRVEALVASLGLPASGQALDFGCGQGVFSGVLRGALPGWKVFGTELSAVALALARERQPDCTFLAPEELQAAGPFDFVFTHHVLEHVTDLPRVLTDMSLALAPRAYMLHILPCGNPGSLEHRMSLWHTQGIQPDVGNRFFFEDPGHLRRLSSRELIEAAEACGFRIRTQNFANHFWGALDWMTDLPQSFTQEVTSRADAKSAWAWLQLSLWWGVLTMLRLLKQPKLGRLSAGFLSERADAEWRDRRRDPAGSEMYLFFERG